VLDGDPLPMGDLGWALLGVAVLVPLATLYLRRTMRLFRRQGYVSRYL
jgi:hypothetical protein